MKPNTSYYATVKIIMSKNTDIHQDLRDGVRGMLLSAPEIGRGFFMYTDTATGRYLRTSKVVEVGKLEGDALIFKTQNSVYRLSNIEEAKP